MTNSGLRFSDFHKILIQNILEREMQSHPLRKMYHIVPAALAAGFLFLFVCSRQVQAKLSHLSS
jgi:hypothetical protein